MECINTIFSFYHIFVLNISFTSEQRCSDFSVAHECSMVQRRPSRLEKQRKILRFSSRIPGNSIAEETNLKQVESARAYHSPCLLRKHCVWSRSLKALIPCSCFRFLQPREVALIHPSSVQVWFGNIQRINSARLIIIHERVTNHFELEVPFCFIDIHDKDTGRNRVEFHLFQR